MGVGGTGQSGIGLNHQMVLRDRPIGRDGGWGGVGCDGITRGSGAEDETREDQKSDNFHLMGEGLLLPLVASCSRNMASDLQVHASITTAFR